MKYQNALLAVAFGCVFEIAGIKRTKMSRKSATFDLAKLQRHATQNNTDNQRIGTTVSGFVTPG
jgi:hypothetical protein